MGDDLEITKAEKIKILLTEYQVAQQNADAAGDRVWKLTGILFITALGSIALMVQAHQLELPWLVWLIAVGSIALIFFWTITFARELFYSRVTNVRMQEIEKSLGLHMGLHRSIRYWDDFNSSRNVKIMREARNLWQTDRYIWPNFCWPREGIRWLGRQRTKNWAIFVAFGSGVVILLVAFGSSCIS